MHIFYPQFTQNSNVKAILFYRSINTESWIITQRTINRLQVFVNRFLRRISGIHWLDKITNRVMEANDQEPVIKPGFHSNAIACIACVNENRKKRKGLHW